MANFETLKTEILIALRGRLTTSRLSQLLGLKFNKYARWEQETAELFLEDFLKICSVRKVPVEKVLKDVFDISDFKGEPHELLQLLFVGKSHNEIAQEAGVSRVTVSRWLAGATPISLVSFLSLLERLSCLHIFLLRLFSPEQLPSIRSELTLFLKQKEFVYSQPLALLVLSYLELSAEARSKIDLANLLTSHFQIDSKTIDSIYLSLESLGLVERNDGNLRRVARRLLIHLDREAFLNMTCFWRGFLNQLFSMQKTDFPHSLAGCKIMAVSKEASEKIEKLSLAFNYQISDVLREDVGDKSAIKLLLFDVLTLNDIKVTNKT